MKTIILDKNKEEYPYIYLPDIVINHIQKGYSESEKLDFLKFEKPRKKTTVQQKEQFVLYSSIYDLKEREIELETILNLKYDSVNENLEDYTYYLDKYELPKKPLLHNIKEIEYNDYEEFFQGIFKSLILIPIIGFLLYMLVAIFGPIFISFEERRELPLFKYLSIISIGIYSIFLTYGLSNGLLKKKKRIERELLDETIRKSLLDNYKEKIKSIINKYNRQFEKEFEIFKQEYEKKKNSAEIGILKEKIEQNKEIALVNIENSQKGKSEVFFLKHLYNEFGRDILIDYSPNIGKNPFQPDFILLDKKTGIYFDIEIDEPYSLIDGKTIHHNRTKDAERNSFFNEINWGVIRFTEKQIVESPIKCVNFIKDTLNAIHNRKECLTHEIEIENFWTHEEALIMKMNDFRNSYNKNTGYNTV